MILTLEDSELVSPLSLVGFLLMNRHTVIAVILKMLTPDLHVMNTRLLPFFPKD